MKTREVYLAEVAIFQAKVRRIARIGIIILFGFLGGLGFVIALMREVVDKTSPYFLLPTIAIYGGLILWGVLLVRYNQELARKCGLVCSTCAKPLTTHDIKLVTATHNCPYCGLPFFAI